jgi:GT2 family glycosyltransferase
VPVVRHPPPPAQRAPARHPPRDTAYVLLVNWNRWGDTTECLESVFRSRYDSYRVVVCDNGSTDGSLEKIRGWAAGCVEAPHDPQHPLAGLVSPPVAKPISCAVLSRAEAERGGSPSDASASLVLIDDGANLGFSGGCNVGLRYALRQPDCRYVWLLNNDTVVDPGALRALIARLEAKPGAGQCGSRLLFYHDPGLVQTLGGERYNKWLAGSRPVSLHSVSGHDLAAAVESRMSYVTGASLCATREFVEAAGLLDESYFAYFEELDWLARAGGRFALAYAHDSIVYHKEGRGIGSHRAGVKRSLIADYFLARARLRYTRRYVPLALPTVMVAVLLTAVNRLRRRQPDRARMVLRVLLSPSTYARDDANGPGPLARFEERYGAWASPDRNVAAG